RLADADELQRHPRFPSASKESAGKWSIPHPRKHNIRADSALSAIQISEGERKLFRFFLLEADNGTSEKGETIWPEHPDAYTGTSLYEKFEAYTAFINERGFEKKW